jgi:hypothetical protein
MPAASRVTRLQEILAAPRAATADPGNAGGIELRRACSGQDMGGSAIARFDATNDACVIQSKLVPISVTNGFDGRLPWMRDLSGASTPREGRGQVRLTLHGRVKACASSRDA